MSANLDYQLKKPPVQCPHCGRWFKHNGYYIRHDRDSIISCVTRIKIAENDKKERERLHGITGNREPGYYKKRWYQKHREEILQKKKEWYIDNKELVHENYIKNRDKNRDRKREANDKWKTENKERTAEYNKQYYKNKKYKQLVDEERPRGIN
tara:strand:- start:4038 stop:4496 length:459 start_codon:yes stop_codon:yes gene_type:complete